MAITNRAPLRFSLLTVIVWMAVAAGVILLLWQVITRLSSRNLPALTATPNPTQVDQTIAAILSTKLTSTASTIDQTATSSPTARSTAIPATEPSPAGSVTPSNATQTSLPQVLCDRAAAGNPIDISIPDDTVISPGQGFTKTWKLVNQGSCTWTTSYSSKFFYGDRMGAPESIPLQVNVMPSQSVEISIEMIAPLSGGTYQGNWKLSNPGGVLFGIGPNGDSPFWVRIIVPQSPAFTSTSTPGMNITQTATPSATSTPPVQASGELTLVPGDTIDLDALILNAGDTDLVYQVDANNYHWLAPLDRATIGVYGNFEPNLANCQSASMSPAPIAVESLSVGTYLCYTTHPGRTGRMLLESVNPGDFTLTLQLLTWAMP